MLKKGTEHIAKQTFPVVRFAASTLFNNHSFYTGNTCNRMFGLPVVAIRARMYMSG